MKGKHEDPSLQLALAAADLADDGKAIGITILDLREVSSVADYFVIASGRSHIQVEAICDRIAEGVRDRLDRRPIAVEGLEQALWGILDYGSVVVHVFQESVRELYDLERLWSLAPRWKHGEAPPKTRTGQTGEAAVAAAPKAERKTKAKATKATTKKTTESRPAASSAKASAARASAKNAATTAATKAATKAAPKAGSKPAASTKVAAAKAAPAAKAKAKPAAKPAAKASSASSTRAAAAKKPSRKSASPEA